MRKFKPAVGYILLTIVFILIGWFGRILYTLPKTKSVEKAISQIVKPTPLVKYQIDNLSRADIPAGNITIGDLISETSDFSTYKYSMQFKPDLTDSIKKVSGIINIPKGDGEFPVVVMFRGFVSQEIYTMGTGTQPSAKVFAKNGYITIAPDFLGYGESDKEATDIFETRFQTWVTAVTTLKSVPSIEKWDGKNIFIWGHSNGGQIALTTLEITGANYPTVLWDPVSMRFPASVLYYIDEAEDGGKYLISQTEKFQEIYDSEKFSLTNFFGYIKAPIQINQGTKDTAVPFWQTDELYKKLQELSIKTEYKKYEGADHNMRPLWDQAVENALNFYKINTK